ncbi:hypothetical protein L6452_22459 [Arctium lappa]|uniref:Uncharacterized protein n=1 Tax=Arctium lappa TaxID=4217 RepID=A0ACB9AZV4_ARCLA|nr:hypothetical protein L6452_22459 [Arctium lappa]
MYSSRICIKSSYSSLIFETVIVILDGGTHYVRVKEVCGWIPDFLEEDSTSEGEEGEGSVYVEVQPSDGYKIDEDEALPKRIPDSFQNEEFLNRDNVEVINKDEVGVEGEKNDPFGIMWLLEEHPIQNTGLDKVRESDILFYPPGFTPHLEGTNRVIKVGVCSENQWEEWFLDDNSIGAKVAHQEEAQVAERLKSTSLPP